jgi:hypothetical protein
MESFQMSIKRTIDEQKQTITLEFTDGQMFGPFKFDPTSDALTRMIGDLDARVAQLEAHVKRITGSPL